MKVLANIHRGTRDYDKALEYYSRSESHLLELQLMKRVTAVRGIMADIYMELERYEEALADFNRAIAIDKTNADVYNYRGELLGEIKGGRVSGSPLDPPLGSSGCV